MKRPSSIINFERFFWASMAFSIATVIFAWPDIQAESVKSGSTIAITAVVLQVLIFGGISVGFWYGIARRASNVVRWIYVIWMGFSSASTLYGLAEGQGIQDSAVAISLVSTALTIASMVFLFRSDAVSWLTRKSSVDTEIFK